MNIASKDFRSPYTQQADLAVERQLTKDMALTVSGIWSRGLHLTSVNDINIGAPGPGGDVHASTTRAGRIQRRLTYSTPVYVRQNRVDTRYARINIIDAGLE